MKHLYILLIGLILSNASCSQSEKKENEKPTNPLFEEGTNNSLLWQITGNGLKDTSYVFGTMHLIDKEHFYFPESLRNLIKSSDLVVLEIGEELNNPLKALSLLQLDEGQSLFDYFTDEQEETIFTWVQDNMGLNKVQFEAAFGKMKPFVLVSLGAEMDVAENGESYEKTIMEIQSKNGIPLKGLETLEDQIGVFDNFTDEEQASMVMETIRMSGEEDTTMELMIDLYTRQNIDSLHLLIQQEGETLADKEDELLNNRNHNWIPKINQMVKGKTVFIAVGAGHLAGEQGVLQLLREEGYKVTPLKL